MWKEVKNIIMKLILLLFPFFVLLPLYCRFFPEYYLDEEYAMYRQQNDYVTKNQEYNRVIILGDSRTKAGFVPSLLSEDTYNLALGGATPIEGYYSLEKYLKNHEAPKFLVIAYAPMHYMDVDTLWTRSIYFHTFGDDCFKDLIRTASGFEDTDSILIDHYRSEYLMYRFYLPNKYATALKKSGFFFRHSTTMEKYTTMVESKGQNYYGTADGSDGVDGEAKVSDFKESDMITYYLNRMFSLCREKQIQVILEQLPVNETSYGIFAESFKSHFRSYMQSVMIQNPDVIVYGDFYCYSNSYFGDADHLNQKGSQEFCKYMKEKYPSVFP